MSDFPFNMNHPTVEWARLADWTDGELLHVYAEMQAEQALREIVARYGAMVYGVCLRILGDHHEAEDAAQATLILFCRRAPKLSRATSLPGWLAKTARTTALNARRRTLAERHRDTEAARSKEMSVQDDSATASEAAAHLDEALGSLPAKYHDAVVLRYMAGLSAAETAESLGCPRSTATSRVLRGLEKMRKFLGRRGYAPAPAAVAGMFGQTQAAMPAGLAAQIVACCTGK
ncbi:MAG: sigma-70 family RNA polymerase sigma factor, partial [Thermoguttaceae bacterium]